MRSHANMRVIRSCQRSGQQNEHGIQAGCLVSLANQLLADSEPLIVSIDGQVGEIGAIAEVGDRARDANQAAGVSSRDDHLGVFEHAPHRLRLIDRPARPGSIAPGDRRTRQGQAPGTILFDRSVPCQYLRGRRAGDERRPPVNDACAQAAGVRKTANIHPDHVRLDSWDRAPKGLSRPRRSPA